MSAGSFHCVADCKGIFVQAHKGVELGRERSDLGHDESGKLTFLKIGTPLFPGQGLFWFGASLKITTNRTMSLMIRKVPSLLARRGAHAVAVRRMGSGAVAPPFARTPAPSTPLHEEHELIWCGAINPTQRFID